MTSSVTPRLGAVAARFAVGEHQRMRGLIVLAVLLVGSNGLAGRSVRVKSYVTKKGAYVAPSNRTSADSSRMNNWSTKGNANPYTGARGTKPWAPAKVGR